MRLSRDGDGRDTGLVLSNSPLDLLVLAVVSPLVLSLGNKDVVLVDLSFLDLGLSAGQGAEVTTALETFRGDESLDLGSLGVGLSILLLLRLDLSADDKLSDIIVLGQVEEFADLRCSLGSQSLRQDVVGQSWDIGVSLLDYAEGEYGDIVSNNASSDRLSDTLSGSSRSVARVTLG